MHIRIVQTCKLLYTILTQYRAILSALCNTQWFYELWIAQTHIQNDGFVHIKKCMRRQYSPRESMDSKFVLFIGLSEYMSIAILYPSLLSCWILFLLFFWTRKWNAIFQKNTCLRVGGWDILHRSDIPRAHHSSHTPRGARYFPIYKRAGGQADRNCAKECRECLHGNGMSNGPKFTDCSNDWIHRHAHHIHCQYPFF